MLEYPSSFISNIFETIPLTRVTRQKDVGGWKDAKSVVKVFGNVKPGWKE